MFSELGYDAATFQAIAVRADLTRPAINHYFASKRVLYREVVERTNAFVVASGIARAEAQPDLLGRVGAFITSTIQADSDDRSAAAFLVTSVLEAQRHPELRSEEHDSLANSRKFLTWAVDDAVERGELAVDSRADTTSLVELLVALLWGMGFYAGYVGSHDDVASITQRLDKLLSGKLWNLTG